MDYRTAIERPPRKRYGATCGFRPGPVDEVLAGSAYAALAWRYGLFRAIIRREFTGRNNRT